MVHRLCPACHLRRLRICAGRVGQPVCDALDSAATTQTPEHRCGQCCSPLHQSIRLAAGRRIRSTSPSGKSRRSTTSLSGAASIFIVHGARSSSPCSCCLRCCSWCGAAAGSLQDVAFAASRLRRSHLCAVSCFCSRSSSCPCWPSICAARPGRTRPARDQRFVSALRSSLWSALMAREISREKASCMRAWPSLSRRKLFPGCEHTAGRGNLLANFNWGGYLEWQAPEVKELIDLAQRHFCPRRRDDDYLRATKPRTRSPCSTNIASDMFSARSMIRRRICCSHNAEWKTHLRRWPGGGFERVQ